jgi:hypothetical protein
VTAFDFVAILILGVSALVGFVRGATRELMTVIAFLLAIMISVFGLRFTGPIFRHAIHTPWLANAAAILVVFIAAYIVIKVLGSALTRRIHNTRALGTARGVQSGLQRGHAAGARAALDEGRRPLPGIDFRGPYVDSAGASGLRHGRQGGPGSGTGRQGRRER